MAEPTIPDDADIFDPNVLDAADKLTYRNVDTEEAQVLAYIERRKRAYANVFSAGERNQADINIVLSDIMWFSKVWVPTYDIKDGIHAEELSKRKDGRREVFQRIKNFSGLDSDALLMLYTDATTK